MCVQHEFLIFPFQTSSCDPTSVNVSAILLISGWCCIDFSFSFMPHIPSGALEYLCPTIMSHICLIQCLTAPLGIFYFSLDYCNSLLNSLLPNSSLSAYPPYCCQICLPKAQDHVVICSSQIPKDSLLPGNNNQHLRPWNQSWRLLVIISRKVPSNPTYSLDLDYLLLFSKSTCHDILPGSAQNPPPLPGFPSCSPLSISSSSTLFSTVLCSY